MKILLIALVFAAVAHGETTNRIGVLFTPPIDHGTGTTYHIYSSTNLALPLVQWPWLTNSPFSSVTNLGGIEVLVASDQSRYYILIASNLHGATGFSAPVESRRLSTGIEVSIGLWKPKDQPAPPGVRSEN